MGCSNQAYKNITLNKPLKYYLSNITEPASDISLISLHALLCLVVLEKDFSGFLKCLIWK